MKNGLMSYSQKINNIFLLSKLKYALLSYSVIISEEEYVIVIAVIKIS